MVFEEARPPLPPSADSVLLLALGNIQRPCSGISPAVAKEVRQRNIRISIIGIPKTIDNDINFVPQSFGFDTAVDKATEAIGCAHVEAVGTPNGIGIVKLMGRESGFIAAQSALALREANFVLIPKRRSSCTATAACSPRWNGASNCAGTPSSSRPKARASTSSSRMRPATPPGIPCCPMWGAC